jgi:hypothetical protein
VRCVILRSVRKPSDCHGSFQLLGTSDQQRIPRTRVLRCSILEKREERNLRYIGIGKPASSVLSWGSTLAALGVVFQATTLRIAWEEALRIVTHRSEQGLIMARPNLIAAQSLPRFLLPQLSWTASGSPAKSNGVFVEVQRRRHSAFARIQPADRKTSCRTAASPWRQLESRRSQTTASSRLPPYLRAFHASARRQRDHHFDTLKFVQRLQDEGFTEEQSVAMMKVLSDVIEER